MGRRLFGRWHLGLGRPSLPIAVCDVSRCAEAMAWCATHFDEAPAVVNLFDPDVATRGDLVRRLRARGWDGRMVWVPISVISAGLVTARTLICASAGPHAGAARGVVHPAAPALRRAGDARACSKQPRRPRRRRTRAAGVTRCCKVLVTDGEQRPALAIVRKPRSAGHVCARRQRARRKPGLVLSRLQRQRDLPVALQRTGILSSWLQDFVARERIDVVLPVTDVTMYLCRATRMRYEP